MIKNLSKKKIILLNRILKAIVTGICCFGIDLILLYLLVEFFNIHYTFSSAFGFTFAHSLNYFISREWTFKGTKTKLGRGYLSFFIIALIGVFILIPAMTFFVELFNINYLISRTIIAISFGSFNFLMNYFFTFDLSNELCE